MLNLIFILTTLGCSQKDEPNPAPKATPKEESTSKTTVKEQESSIDQYRKQAKELVSSLDSNKDDALILQKSDALTKLGLAILPDLIKRYPNCKEYLNAVSAVGLTLKTLPLEEIESGYHKDGKLPKTPSGECYHGKDLVVHPATVSALAQKGLTDPKIRAQAKEEITEVLGHLKEVTPKNP